MNVYKITVSNKNGTTIGTASMRGKNAVRKFKAEYQGKKFFQGIAASFAVKLAHQCIGTCCPYLP